MSTLRCPPCAAPDAATCQIRTSEAAAISRPASELLRRNPLSKVGNVASASAQVIVWASVALDRSCWQQGCTHTHHSAHRMSGATAKLFLVVCSCLS